MEVVMEWTLTGNDEFCRGIEDLKARGGHETFGEMLQEALIIYDLYLAEGEDLPPTPPTKRKRNNPNIRLVRSNG
jgi:hypothetical protein